jgi:hypothetical protein
MYHDSWWLLGDFTLEESKREEFTKDMELLLYKIGFRKKVEKEINGCSIPMVERVSVDEDGILTFDYNVMFPGEYVEYFINVRTSEYELGRWHGSWAVSRLCKLVAAVLVYYWQAYCFNVDF